MRFMLPRKKSVDETEILRNEFDELLQDQLTELRPLRRRQNGPNTGDVSLRVSREGNAAGLPTVVKIGQ